MTPRSVIMAGDACPSAGVIYETDCTERALLPVLRWEGHMSFLSTVSPSWMLIQSTQAPSSSAGVASSDPDPQILGGWPGKEDVWEPSALSVPPQGKYFLTLWPRTGFVAPVLCRQWAPCAFLSSLMRKNHPILSRPRNLSWARSPSTLTTLPPLLTSYTSQSTNYSVMILWKPEGTKKDRKMHRSAESS